MEFLIGLVFVSFLFGGLILGCHCIKNYLGRTPADP